MFSEYKQLHSSRPKN